MALSLATGFSAETDSARSGPGNEPMTRPSTSYRATLEYVPIPSGESGLGEARIAAVRRAAGILCVL